jgi:transposase
MWIVLKSSRQSPLASKKKETKMDFTIIGIDLSKDKFDFATFLEKKSLHKIFSNDSKGFQKLESFLEKKKVGKVHAVMEATGTYAYALALHLLSNNHRVSIVNPCRIKGYKEALGKHVKTDKEDSFAIFRYGKEFQETLPLWKPSSEKMLELKFLVLRREQLNEMLQQEKNRIQMPSLWSGKNGWIQPIADGLKREKEKIEKVILELVSQEKEFAEDFQNLLTIMGIGKWTAVSLLVVIDGIERFDKARQLASFVGVTPTHRESGSSIRGASRISKKGSPQLRKTLFMAACSAKRHSPHLKAFAEKKQAEGKPAMKILVAIMRKLLHIVFAVLKKKEAFDPEKVERLRRQIEAKGLKVEKKKDVLSS